MIPQSHFLMISGILFALGLFGALTRRNAVGILMSIELVLNAANINLVTFSRSVPSNAGLGQVFALFVIAIAAASAVVGLVLIIAVTRKAKTVFIDKVDLMKW